MKKIAKKADYTYSVGRRKSAVARVRLFRGKKENLVNGEVIGRYFPGKVMALLWQKPFELTKTVGKYYATVKVLGGGKKGQLEAVVHGIARALAKESPEKFKPLLRKAGLLTRDARVRERRMVGTGGKARKQKQSPKR